MAPVLALADVQKGLSDVQALALTAWAEARGDISQGNSSVEERIAVMMVIRNRAADTSKRWPTTIVGVCFQKYQFSCWLDDPNANHVALMALADLAISGQPSADPVYDETLALAEIIAARGPILDRTGGATHYYAPAAMSPPGRVPSWAVGQSPTAIIGTQRFYRL